MKKFISISMALIFVLLVGISSALAQEKLPTSVRGGVLNGKATSLQKPAYPEDARRDNASGPVSVSVTIDEQGNVIEAKAAAEYKVPGSDADGGTPEMKPVHPALQEAAEKAALASKFSPTRLSGQPVKVMGTILYNFVSSPLADEKTMPRSISGGVLNGKAVYLPLPEFPEAAKAVKASGMVSVQVIIDENGMVASATAVSGHPLLRAASVEAAKHAQFSPTMLEGKAVKVEGILTYNFVP